MTHNAPSVVELPCAVCGELFRPAGYRRLGTARLEPLVDVCPPCEREVAALAGDVLRETGRALDRLANAHAAASAA